MENLKTDLEQDEVFVFTPKGRVVTLPVGSTTVDFAYAVHTEVGHACIGAKVNGRLVPLDHQLHSGDTCEIFTSKVETAGPSQDWLQLRRVAAGPQQDPPVVQPRAARRHDRGRARRADRGVPPRGPAGAADVDVASSCKTVIARLQLRRPRRAAGGHRRAPRLGASRRPAGRPRLLAAATTTSSSRRTVLRPAGRTAPRSDNVGVHVEGLDDVLVRLAECCTPVPGDEIIGFVTRGRGVSACTAPTAPTRCR